MDRLEKNNINKVEWKIFNDDYLRWNDVSQFQFIVGNPPYITYSELAKDEQKYVKENFNTCVKGKFDYCYAFIENAIQYLDSNGKMVYLVPNSIYKNVYAQNLRKLIKKYPTTKITKLSTTPNKESDKKFCFLPSSEVLV